MVPRRKPPAGTVWMRIREALIEAGKPATQTHVAKMLKVSQPSVSEWNTATGCPKMEHARILARELGVCIDWLLNGVEPKRLRPDDPVAQRLWNLWPRLSAFTKGRIAQIAEDNGGQEDDASFRRPVGPGPHRRGSADDPGTKSAA